LEVRYRLVGTLLAADPLEGVMLVVVAVGKQAVTQRAEGIAVLIVAALQAGVGFSIAFGMQQADRAQRFQVVMDIAQNFLITFPRIPQDFPNLKGGKMGPQGFETRDGQEMVVDIGRGTGPGQRPELEKTVIDDIERLGFVAKAVFSVGLVRFLSLRTSAFGRVRVGTGLVRTGIIYVGCLRIAGGGKAAVFPAGLAIAVTAFFVQIPSQAWALGGRGVTTLSGMSTFHPRASLDQLAIGR